MIEINTINLTPIDGDLAVSHDATIGGDVMVNGNSVFKGGLKITGWLEANNIKAANKGMFSSMESLNVAYSEPSKGWWAIVLDGNIEDKGSIPGYLYIAENGVWVKTESTAGNITVDNEPYFAKLDELKKSLSSEEANRKVGDDALQGNIDALDIKTTEAIEAESAARNTEVSNEATARTNAVKDEANERKAMDAQLDAKINALSLGAKATASVSKGYIYLNESTSITVSGALSASSSINADIITISSGDSILKTAENLVSTSVVNTVTLSNDSGKASKVYTVSVTYKGANFIATTSVNGRYPILYGFANTASEVTTKLSARDSAVGTYVATATEDEQYMFILVPIGINELNSFTMGGAPAVFAPGATTLTINNVSIPYKVYRTQNGYNIGTTLTINAQ